MDTVPYFVFLVISAFFGLCFGSFATALIYRIPRNIPWIFDSAKKGEGLARSACPTCNHVLGSLDLVPFFSWLFSRGKCRHCGQKIPIMYPAVEITTMFLTVIMFSAWGIQWATLPVLLSVPILVAALVIDWEHMILPDDLNIVFFVLSLLFVAALGFQTEWSGGILAGHLAAGVLLPLLFGAVSFILGKIKGQDALGIGDLKFLPSAGLFLGMAALPTYLGVSGLLGLVTAVLKRKSGEGGLFPFGPALIISFYLHLFLTGIGFEYTW